MPVATERTAPLVQGTVVIAGEVSRATQPLARGASEVGAIALLIRAGIDHVVAAEIAAAEVEGTVCTAKGSAREALSLAGLPIHVRAIAILRGIKVPDIVSADRASGGIPGAIPATGKLAARESQVSARMKVRLMIEVALLHRVQPAVATGIHPTLTEIEIARRRTPKVPIVPAMVRALADDTEDAIIAVLSDLGFQDPVSTATLVFRLVCTVHRNIHSAKAASGAAAHSA
jgi:hypothetical protein